MCCEVYCRLIAPFLDKLEKEVKNEGEINVSNTYVTLNEFLNENNKAVKQVVYKVDGDYTGDIKGDNIIVILMNGDVNGDINSKEGDVVLIRGDINGDVKANKVICQQPKSEYENYIDKLSGIDKLSKPNKKETFKQPPPDYVRCTDCAYAEDYSSNMYKYSKYNGMIVKDNVRICDLFKEK